MSAPFDVADAPQELEVKIADKVALTPAHVNARNTTLRLDGAQNTKETARIERSPPLPLVKKSHQRKIIPYASRKQQTPTIRLGVSGVSKQKEINIVAMSREAQQDKIEEKEKAKEAIEKSARTTEDVVAEFQMAMSPRGDRFVDDGAKSHHDAALSQISAAFAEASFPEQNESQTDPDTFRAARNAFSAIASEIPKCAPLLNAIKREYEGWIVNGAEDSSRSSNVRSKRTFEASVQRATVHAASAPKMVPAKELAAKARLRDAKKHGALNRFNEDKKAQQAPGRHRYLSSGECT